MIGEFTCAICGATFEKGWSDLEALTEAATLFPHEMQTGQPMEVVCDDCFKSLDTLDRVEQNSKER